MIRLEGISKTYGSRSLFTDVSFTLGKKERCALIGRNGTGKSTLCKILVGDVEADSGEIILPRGYTIGYLRQHLVFTHPTVREETLHAAPQREPHEADALLCGLGFTVEDLTRSPDEFSGGYQLRIELAKTLLQKPDLLLLDEPTNYLDIVSIRFLERVLKHWHGECIVISHDRSFLNRVCTHCLGLQRGSIRKVEGDTSAYFSRILEDEMRITRENENLKKQKAHLTKYVERFRFKASKASQAQSKLKALEKLGEIEDLADEHALSFSFSEAPHPGKQVAKVKNISFSYDVPLIRGVSFEIMKGERLAIVGKNGCGKSTMLKLLSKELTPSSGHISFSMNAQSGVFGQTNVERLDPEWTVLQAIGKANPVLKEQEVRLIAGQMLFHKDEAKKKIGVLSGGEKSRVLMGRVLATPSNILFLDEPTNHLDLESVEALLRAIHAFSGAVVLITHNEWILDAISFDKIIACREDGQHVHLGNYASFMEAIGWNDEQNTKPAKQHASGNDYAERKALRNKIQSLEKTITKKEKQRASLEAQLITLAEEEKHADILDVSAVLENVATEVETLYHELDALYIEQEDYQ